MWYGFVPKPLVSFHYIALTDNEYLYRAYESLMQRFHAVNELKEQPYDTKEDCMVALDETCRRLSGVALNLETNWKSYLLYNLIDPYSDRGIVINEVIWEEEIWKSAKARFTKQTFPIKIKSIYNVSSPKVFQFIYQYLNIDNRLVRLSLLTISKAFIYLEEIVSLMHLDSEFHMTEPAWKDKELMSRFNDYELANDFWYKWEVRKCGTDMSQGQTCLPQFQSSTETLVDTLMTSTSISDLKN